MWTTIVTPSTPSTMTRTITTRTICTSEHSSAPWVFHVSQMICHTTLAQVHWVLHVISSACHDERLSLILFDLSLYFNLAFPVFFLSSVLMFPDLQTDLYDPDSVENDLRHSAKGSLVTYDDTYSLTETHDFIDQWLVDAVDWTTAEIVCIF